MLFGSLAGRGVWGMDTGACMVESLCCSPETITTLLISYTEWCWSWNSRTLATACEELTHWKRLWCWEGLRAGGEGDDRGWDGWMASPTRWTWVWVNSGSWWWTGRPGMLQFMGSQRVGHDWATELNGTESLSDIWFTNIFPLLWVVFSLFW